MVPEGKTWLRPGYARARGRDALLPMRDETHPAPFNLVTPLPLKEEAS